MRVFWDVEPKRLFCAITQVQICGDIARVLIFWDIVQVRMHADLLGHRAGAGTADVPLSHVVPLRTGEARARPPQSSAWRSCTDGEPRTCPSPIQRG